jgi:hypothetical protein
VISKIKQSLSAIILVLGVSLLVLTSAASAATAAGSGMRVSPVRTDLVIKPGQYKVVTIDVQNVTKAVQTFKVVVNDFVASSDESGAPALLLNGQSNDRHGLKRYINAPSSVTVPSNGSKSVNVTVKIPKGTPGGGYYGAVRFIPGSASSGSNVSLSGSVGSLILVSVPGDVKESLTLAGLDITQSGSVKSVFTSNKGITAAVRVRNDGDVQEQPFGKLQLKKGDKVLQTIEFNDSTPPGNVLPDSVRKFNIPLKGIGSIGKYTVVANLGYGTKGQLLTGSTSFYVIPGTLLLLAAIIILVILFLIFVFPKMLRNYNRNVVRKANRRR